MTKEFYECIKMTYKTIGYSAFMCHICKKVTHKLNKAMKEMEAQVKDLGSRVYVLEMEKENMAQRMEVMDLKTSKVKNDLEVVGKEVVIEVKKVKEEVKRDLNEELKQREKNSMNVAIYGIEEPTMNDLEERKAHDKRKVE